jgi:tetratricopeptide (TPR) repeat protein
LNVIIKQLKLIKIIKTFYNKGSSLRNLGKYSKAIECYNKAIEIDPNYSIAFNNKGKSLESLGKYSESIECFNRAIEINPNNSICFF